MQNFKKGSLVPRRLGILLASKKKAQHYLVFGCDVVWDGKVLTTARPMKENESLVIVAHGMSAPRKNGTRQQSGFSMGLDWTISSSRNSFTGEYSASMQKKSAE